MKSLQDHPHAAIGALEGPDDPSVVRASRFSCDVEARVGMRSNEVRVERMELARSEECVGTRGAVVHGPVKALCLVLITSELHSFTASSILRGE